MSNSYIDEGSSTHSYDEVLTTNLLYVPNSSNLKSLKCASLNVCGLRRRILYPDFGELISHYDIFCVSETKLDDLDLINLPGYSFVSQVRKQRYLRKSGGIGVFVRNCLFKHVSLVESDSDYILWFKLNKSVFKTEEDLHFGAVYIPPGDSRFNTAEELSVFDVEISNMCIAHKYVHLIGDFNARVADQTGITNVDSFFSKHFEFDEMSDVFDKNNHISRQRRSRDSVLNHEGKVLLDVCKVNNLIILNGRCGSDKSSGELTFRNISVIDYSITTPNLISFVNDFCIIELDPIFTDGHSLICTEFNFNNNTTQHDKPTSTKPNSTKNKPKWKQNLKAKFTENLDAMKINDMLITLRNLENNLDSVNELTINHLCKGISDIFMHAYAMSDTSTQREQSQYTSQRPQKQWFGAECRTARKKYHLAKKIHKINSSNTNKINLIKASKEYKKKMNFYINKFIKKSQNKLRNMHNKDPKEYWKTLNSIDNKKQDPDIILEDLYNFFKNLNGPSENDAPDTDTFPIHIDEEGDEILNSFITETEVRKCIKLLKNYKTCSNDNIINEFIKESVELMMPIYISLFNLILNTDILPECWLEGIIRPIYKRKGDPHEPENYRPITILSCFGKLFTSILNLRLQTFLETNNIIKENQAGFRSGYSTTDHIFVLHALIEILKRKKIKLFCGFIDVKKAFDSVWRVGLWQKMLSYNINGKYFDLSITCIKTLNHVFLIMANNQHIFNVLEE